MQESGSEKQRPMETKQGVEDDCSVSVAVHIRPLIDSELSDGCQPCLSVATEQQRVFAGANSFTYDHVFGGGGLSEGLLYDKCVLPLVEGLFKGYNATVFAYGQTGSGKTYTMGSAFAPGGSSSGVIPKVMDTIFSRIASADDTDFTVRVGFVEIHTEEIRDLLVLNAHGGQTVHIREVLGGGICLAGATEKEVDSKSQMAELLSQGTLQRATAATNMNKQSSRSHAIFTITVEQRRELQSRRQEADGEDDGNDSAEDEVDDYLCAKMHLVDLAGSERTKRTKAEGQRLKEGININKGLLALGNVISALSEGKPHVPYRDSKLTRMLQDSLGGNSRTLMIACVSPADVNLEESLNTLRYANRARNIKNKPVVNRDPNAAQLAHLRQQLAAARSEIGMLKRRLTETGGENGHGPWIDPSNASADDAMAAALDEMQFKMSKMDLDNARLRVELETTRQELKDATERLICTQAERDSNALQIEQLLARQGIEAGQSHAGSGDDFAQMGVMQQRLQQIANLEAEVKRLKKVQRASGAYMMSARKQGQGGGSLLSQASFPEPLSPLPTADSGVVQMDDDDAAAHEEAASSLADDEEFAAEEYAHRVEQQKVASELENLQRVLESKEAQMARVISGDGQIASLKKHYDRKLQELQAERDELQKDRTDLLQRMQNLRSTKEEDVTALNAKYKQRLQEMDKQLKEVAKKERRFAQIERLQVRSHDTCQRLQNDILTIKQQKVRLMKLMERSQKEFQAWRKQRERELMTLRRQGMKAAAHVQRLEALQAKQQAVLRRKTEEAEAARKRLKEMVEVHQRANDTRAQRSLQAKSNGVEAQPNNTAPLLRDEKSRREWVEHELDLCCQSLEIQRVLEGEKAQRAEAARQLLEIGKWLARQPGGKQGESLVARKATLQEQISQQSKQILELQQQLMRAKAEEDQKGQAANDARRWNGLKTIVEARSLLKSVFKVAALQKAQVYEGQSELAEAREEAEVLRVKLEAAEQEAAEAKQAAAKAQSVLAETLAASASSPRPVELPQAADEMEGVVESLMEEIQGAEEAANQVAPSADPDTETEPDYISAPESEVSDGDDDDVWDPQHATPWHSRMQRRVRHSGSSRPSSSQARLQSNLEEAEDEFKTMRDALEHPVLMDINHDRSRQGSSPIVKLTVPVLKAHLRGKLVNGSEWRMGNKKREDLIVDYREYLRSKVRERAGAVPLRSNPASSVLQQLPGSCPVESDSAQISQQGAAGSTAVIDLEAKDGQHEALGARSYDHPAEREASKASTRPIGNPMFSGEVDSPDASGSDRSSGNNPAAITPLQGTLPRLRTRLVPDSASDAGSPFAAGSPDGREGTPTARFYGGIRQQCETAIRRAQALKERMETSAASSMSTPNANPPLLRMPPLQLPSNSPSPLSTVANGHAASSPKADSAVGRNGMSDSRSGGSEKCSGRSQSGSPARHILSEIANSGPVSPHAMRVYEKAADTQAAHSRRNQPTMRSGGPLSARLPKNNLASPRPRAAWL